jgi:phage tail-like protein
MAGPRIDPVGNYNFAVRLLDSAEAATAPGLNVQADAGFSECRGLEGKLELHDQPEGGLNDRVRRFPTRMTWGNLTLQRGVGLSRDFWQWFTSYAEGAGSRRDGLVMLLNDERQPVAVWRFKRGLPVRWTGPTLSGTGNEVAIETLEIAHEGLEAQPSLGLGGPA